MSMTPFGVMSTPHTKNPNSAHNKMKMGDHMMNPFHPAAMGMGMMGMHPGMGMNPGMGMAMMGMHPGMGMHPDLAMMNMMGMHPGMGVHPGMMAMGGMGMPYGLGTMNAYNYPDQQDVETEESSDQGNRLKKKRRKKKKKELENL